MTYFQEKNVSRIYSLYSDIFSLQQGDLSIQEYYSILQGKRTELAQYHPLTADVSVLQQQHKEFYVVKFLFELNPSLCHVRAQLMADDSIPTLSNTMSHVLRVTELQPTSSPSMENTALTVGTHSGRGSHRGRGCAHNFFLSCPHCGYLNHPAEHY